MIDIDYSAIKAGGGIITDDKGTVIAECHTVDLPLPKAAHVANEIALRCRMHDALVESLTGLVRCTLAGLDDERRHAMALLAKLEAR